LIHLAVLSALQVILTTESLPNYGVAEGQAVRPTDSSLVVNEANTRAAIILE